MALALGTGADKGSIHGSLVILVTVFTLGIACVRELVSDSGYGHDDLSCMTYDIHLDILLRCVFVVQPLHVHLNGEYPL